MQELKQKLRISLPQSLCQTLFSHQSPTDPGLRICVEIRKLPNAFRSRPITQILDNWLLKMKKKRVLDYILLQMETMLEFDINYLV
nr:hypothetical transcript [Hymenolepis microstoma]